VIQGVFILTSGDLSQPISLHTKRRIIQFFTQLFGLVFLISLALSASGPPSIFVFLENHCLDCHDSETSKGNLNLESLTFAPSNPSNFDKWVLIHDRVANGEMPPKKKTLPLPHDRDRFLNSIAAPLTETDRDRINNQGRAKVRRLNRYEHENKLRHVLQAPWLQLADRLPADGIKHLFSKSGEVLDVSHIQMEQYLVVAEYAVRTAINAAAHPTTKKKFYAREERSMQGYLRYRWSQSSATRTSIPLIGTTPDPEVIRGNKPVTVGDSNPKIREQEAFGFVSGTYTATTKYDFTRMRVPIDGIYQLRMKSYTFTAGPNGRSGGDDHGLTGGRQAWWRPSRTETFPGKRSEPITLYALSNSGDSRWLTTYDAHPKPKIINRTVTLKQGEGIRPDAARLVRTRPGWKGNPNATPEGVPGFAMNWLEVEGPIHESWPPQSYTATMGTLPFNVAENDQVQINPEVPSKTAKERIAQFLDKIIPHSSKQEESVQTYFNIYTRARELGQCFTDAMVMTYAAMLCSPHFLYLDSVPGDLPQRQLAERLAYFLWESPPDTALLDQEPLSDPSVLHRETERLLTDNRSTRFVNQFLDHWLDLRDLNANTPDAELYPDYYLHDLLTESSLRETRLFFRECLDHDLPVRNLIDSEFTYLNECLANHYGIPTHETVIPQRVSLPKDSPRGGLLTQASILRVTANGTTTSPVIRGAWVMERLLGLDIPSPPSGVAAVEPDTRGATTIREQLEKHRETASCNACHAKFDPPGFALESFDIAGGWRDQYRAIDEAHKPVKGLGKNGHSFVFHYAKNVDSGGTLLSGDSFQNIKSLKALLAKEERQIARNLVHQFIVYATGAPVSFADRHEVEAILEACASDYGIRSLLHGVIQSRLFRIK
jgi:hypothetical protein